MSSNPFIITFDDRVIARFDDGSYYVSHADNPDGDVIPCFFEPAGYEPRA